LSSPEPCAPFSTVAEGLVRRALHTAAGSLRSGFGPLVLIDGPSGAGKTTLADALVAAWPRAQSGGPPKRSVPELVHMDDLYPGWDGLAAASESLDRELLRPLIATGCGAWRAWDWDASRPGPTHEVAGGHPLVVEGCGCLTRATSPLATLRVWVTAADDVRRMRALARDRGGFDEHWDRWERQWVDQLEREHPRDLADVVVETTAPTARPRGSVE
jgi:energy-coupling factor transporter ATP-binding protein EcfA2